MAKGELDDGRAAPPPKRVTALWLVTTRGRLTAVSAATGRVRYVYKLKPETFADLELDTRTDDLVFVHEGKWQRIRAKTGKLEEVRSPR